MLLAQTERMGGRQGRKKGRPPNTIDKIIAEATPLEGGHLIPRQRPRDDDYVGVSIRGRTERAHRLAWEFWHGRRIPVGRVVRHVDCSVRSCLAREHLRAGSQAANIEDGWRAGTIRPPRGVVLTPRLVRQLRIAHARGATFAELSRATGFGAPTIRAAVRRRSWRRVRP